MSEPKLSIVIVNYNVKFFLEQCLYAVQSASEGLEVEVLVVDNNSSDGSLAHLRPLFPDVTFIENKDNPGFSKANNQAMLQSRGEYILLLNPDTVIGSCLRSICFFMDEQRKVGAVGVKMIDASGRFLPESKRSFPSPWVSFCKLFGLSRLFPRSKRFASYSLPYLDPDKPHQVDVLSGAFMLLRREALDKVGLLDESFFMYGEDIDLSYRIKLGGYHNYYLPERILHYKGESTKHGDKKYLNAFYGAMMLFYDKYYPRSGKWLSSLIRFSIRLRASYAARYEHQPSKKSRTKVRRVVIFATEESYEAMKEAFEKRFEKVEQVVFWDLDKRRLMEANTRHFFVNKYSDLVFSLPDISVDQLLLFLDRMPDKKINSHLYHRDKGGLLISPGKQC